MSTIYGWQVVVAFEFFLDFWDLWNTFMPKKKYFWEGSGCGWWISTHIRVLHIWQFHVDLKKKTPTLFIIIKKAWKAAYFLMAFEVSAIRNVFISAV